MALFQSLIFYLILIVGIVLFLKLDRRISLLNRILISIVVTIVVCLLFVFISAIIGLVIVVLLIILLISLLEKGNIQFSKRSFKR